MEQLTQPENQPFLVRISQQIDTATINDNTPSNIELFYQDQTFEFTWFSYEIGQDTVLKGAVKIANTNGTFRSVLAHLHFNSHLSVRMQAKLVLFRNGVPTLEIELPTNDFADES